MAHVILLDTLNEDLFVCGNCKSVFNYLDCFLEHKRMCLDQVPLVDPSGEHFIDMNDQMLSDCPEPMLEIVTDPMLPMEGESMLPIESESVMPIVPESILSLPTESVLCNEPLVNDPMLSTQPIVMEEYVVQENYVPQKQFSCDLCKKGFNKRKCLLVHMRSHYVKPYQCLICGRCFKSNSHLQRHIPCHKVWPEGLSETIPKDSDAELMSYACPYCHTLFSNYHKFRVHLKDHQSIKKFKCIQGECTEFFDTVKGILRHVEKAHVSPEYICFICTSKFNSLDDIANHQLNHSDDDYKKVLAKEKYKCTQCDACFTKLEKLSLHMLTETHKKVCVHCERTFVSDKRLRLHLQTHRTMKPYQCHVCQTSFHVKKYLTSHLMKHGTKTFKCSICNSMYKRPDLLKRHMKIHQNSASIPRH